MRKVEELIENIREDLKTSWLPLVEKKDSEVTHSKFFGKPFLKEGETWPECPSCGVPLFLFTQINFKDAPSSFQKEFDLESGLLQVFYCTNTDTCCDCDHVDDYDKYTLIRYLPDEEVKNPAEVEIPKLFKEVPFLTITGWEEKMSVPHFDLLYDLGLNDKEIDSLNEKYGNEGDKLGGYPEFIQGEHEPTCPICKEDMPFLLQIDSEVNVPFMFGDSGIAYLFQCKTHKHEFYFAWDCC